MEPEMTTLKRIQQTLVEALNLGVEPDSLNPEVAIFGEGLDLDSIDGLEIVVALEREFDLIIEDTEMGPEIFANLNAMAEFVDRKSRHKAGDHDG